MTPGAQSLLRPRPSGMLPYLLVSVVGHVLVTLAALLVSWAFAGPKVDLNQKPIIASLVRLGKPRDEKMLPRNEEAPPPPAAKAEPVAEKAPTPVDTAVKIPSKDVAPTKPTKDSKDSKSDAKDTKKSLFDAFSKTARAGKVEPLEGQADGDPNGDSARQEGERYYGLLTSVVHRNYDVSDAIPESERRTLKAEVMLRIGTSGELLEVGLRKASGNELFDSAVVAAVKHAAPFAPPPDHLRDALKKTGVTIVFTP